MIQDEGTGFSSSLGLLDLSSGFSMRHVESKRSLCLLILELVPDLPFMVTDVRLLLINTTAEEVFLVSFSSNAANESRMDDQGAPRLSQ